jgi:3-oxoadipate enol-lactonase
MKPVAAAVVERWFTAKFRASFPEKVGRAQRMLENSPPAGYTACCAAIRDMDQREAVARIKAPTLVIYGESDPVIPASDAHFLAGQIRGATGDRTGRGSPLECRAGRCLHESGE